MAPKQVDLSNFLYGGRVNVSGIIKLSDSVKQGYNLGHCVGTEMENESFGDNVSVGTAQAKLAKRAAS